MASSVHHQPYSQSQHPTGVLLVPVSSQSTEALCGAVGPTLTKHGVRTEHTHSFVSFQMHADATDASNASPLHDEGIVMDVAWA